MCVRQSFQRDLHNRQSFGREIRQQGPENRSSEISHVARDEGMAQRKRGNNSSVLHTYVTPSFTESRELCQMFLPQEFVIPEFTATDDGMVEGLQGPSCPCFPSVAHDVGQRKRFIS